MNKGFAQKVESIPTLEKTYRRITLKAFANSSPGLRFGNPGKRIPFLEGATLKELRWRLLTAKPRNPVQGCEQSPRAFLNPGFQSKHSHPVRAAALPGLG
jgi:hypothetical protein